MSGRWAVVLTGDWYLPHLVNMLRAYRGNDEQALCRDEVIEQIESQMIRDGDPIFPTTRPLVVMDPEDREAVERLSRYITAAECGDGLAPLDAVGAALREFADPKPPKPEEPTGLGAVVEDCGCRWTLAVRIPGSFPWVGEHGGARGWGEFSDAVEVLSEGVTP